MPRPSRREFVQSAVAGSLLMPGLIRELLAADSSDPLAAKAPHFPAKAKSVIFLFMSGGVSHVDSFDPKPRLIADHGKPVTFDHPETRNRPGYEKLFLKRPDWKFSPRGKSGIEVSDLFPHLAKRRRHRADPLDAHQPLEPLQRHARDAHRLVHVRPAEHRRLGELRPRHDEPQPAVVPRARPPDALRGHAGLGRGLPARSHQGTRVVPGAEPIANLRPRVAPADRQELELDALKSFNEAHLATRPDDAGSSGAHPVIRDRVRHAVGDARSARSRAGDRRHARPLRPEARAERRLRLAMPGRPPAGRARRALRRTDRHRLVAATGTRTATWPTTAGSPCKSISRSRGLAPGPETARPARRRARRLDDRVRPDAVQQHGRRIRAASITPGRSVPGWPGRREARHRPRRDRRARHPRRREARSTSTTSTPRSCT